MAVQFESASLFADLQEWIVNRFNGVVFVTTVRKRVLCLNLTDGYITYCAGAGKHGQEAVAALADANIANYSFKADGDYPFRMRDEVVHDEVLTTLEAKFRQSGLRATDMRPDPALEASEETETVYVSARMRVPAGPSAKVDDGAPRNTLPRADGSGDQGYVSARMRRPAAPNADTPRAASQRPADPEGRGYMSARMRMPAGKGGPGKAFGGGDTSDD